MERFKQRRDDFSNALERLQEALKQDENEVIITSRNIYKAIKEKYIIQFKELKELKEKL